MAYQLFLIIMNKLLDGEDEIALVQLQVKVWLYHQQVTNTKQMLGRINFPWDNCTFGSFACKSYTDDWGLCKENVELRVIFSFFRYLDLQIHKSRDVYNKVKKTLASCKLSGRKCSDMSVCTLSAYGR